MPRAKPADKLGRFSNRRGRSMPRPTLSLNIPTPNTNQTAQASPSQTGHAAAAATPSPSNRSAGTAQNFPGMPGQRASRPGGGLRRPMAPSLNLGGLGMSGHAHASPSSPVMGANQRLAAQAAQIRQQLHGVSPTAIAPTSRPPSLDDLGSPTIETPHHSTSNLGNDYFINVRAKHAAPNAPFDGHKVHLSVDPRQFARAYAALAPLLFSSQSPVTRFKLTDMARAGAATPSPANDRVTQGAQFTLYLQPNPATGSYDAQQIHALRSFVGQCEHELNRAGVGARMIPGSDVPVGSHASYRNENYERSGMTMEMANEPMCQLLRHA
ncbi:hypothetical protein C6V07_02265 [Burkholderia gladioli]|nr:hypothetical protein C6V07_02265 [Burkholderia gladioli]